MVTAASLPLHDVSAHLVILGSAVTSPGEGPRRTEIEQEGDRVESSTHSLRARDRSSPSRPRAQAGRFPKIPPTCLRKSAGTLRILPLPST